MVFTKVEKRRVAIFVFTLCVSDGACGVDTSASTIRDLGTIHQVVWCLVSGDDLGSLTIKSGKRDKCQAAELCHWWSSLTPHSTKIWIPRSLIIQQQIYVSFALNRSRVGFLALSYVSCTQYRERRARLTPPKSRLAQLSTHHLLVLGIRLSVLSRL